MPCNIELSGIECSLVSTFCREVVLSKYIYRIKLLAMATGTGKTRTVLGMIYRFLMAKRFKRILYLVDRKMGL